MLVQTIKNVTKVGLTNSEGFTYLALGSLEQHLVQTD